MKTHYIYIDASLVYETQITDDGVGKHRGEYLKFLRPDLSGMPSGRYRISIAPKTGRFQFRFERDALGEIYHLFDHEQGQDVQRPAGGGWCAMVVRAWKLAKTRFNLIPVKRA